LRQITQFTFVLGLLASNLFDKKKWEVKYRNHSHKQQSKSFLTKREAEIFERKVLTELSQNIWSNPSDANILLEEIWNQWLASKSELKVKTRTDYESLWNIHIKPSLAKVPLKTLLWICH
jgi:hypothetical protein